QSEKYKRKSSSDSAPKTTGGGYKKMKKIEETEKSCNDSIIKKGGKAAMPESLSPMLCTLAKEPFNKEGWLNEVKWDGYRIIAFKNKKHVSLRSRSGIDYSERYTVVRDAVEQVTGNFVI